MHDTLKKPRDILMVSYAVRFPDLAARSRAMGGEVEMDPAVSALHRWNGVSILIHVLRRLNKTDKDCSA